MVDFRGKQPLWLVAGENSSAIAENGVEWEKQPPIVVTPGGLTTVRDGRFRPVGPVHRGYRPAPVRL